MWIDTCVLDVVKLLRTNCLKGGKMTTLRDVRRWMAQEGVLGAESPEMKEEFKRRSREVYEAVVAENGLPPTWIQFPDDTVLGDRSDELFDELVAWMEEQRSSSDIASA